MLSQQHDKVHRKLDLIVAYNLICAFAIKTVAQLESDSLQFAVYFYY